MSSKRLNFPNFENVLDLKLKFTHSGIFDSPFTPATFSLTFFFFFCDTRNLLTLVPQFPLLKQMIPEFLPTSQGCCEDKWCIHEKRSNIKFEVFLCCCHWTVTEQLIHELLWNLLNLLKILFGAECGLTCL